MDVALKAIYNDGNAGQSIGFKGVCSNDLIKKNMKNVICSLEGTPCRIFYDSGLRNQRPTKNDYCYESRLFIDWRFGVGTYHRGAKKDQPIPIKKVNPSDIAVITTRYPGQREDERIIVGIYKIDKIGMSPPKKGNMLFADKYSRLELKKDIAAHLKFWNYYNTSSVDKKEWHEGLFRYLKPEETDSILYDLKELLDDAVSRNILDSFR